MRLLPYHLGRKASRPKWKPGQSGEGLLPLCFLAAEAPCRVPDAFSLSQKRPRIRFSALPRSQPTSHTGSTHRRSRLILDPRGIRIELI